MIAARHQPAFPGATRPVVLTRAFLLALTACLILGSGNDLYADDLNTRQELSEEHWPEVCSRAISQLRGLDDPRYRVTFGNPETIRSPKPIAWLEISGYRIPVPVLDGVEWHYRLFEPGPRLQIRYGRQWVLEITRETQEVLTDIADVTGFTPRTRPENAEHRRDLMADVFGRGYTRDDALLHSLQLVPSDIDCERDRYQVIGELLALTNKTDAIENEDDRAYQYFGAFDGFVTTGRREDSTLWKSRVWRNGAWLQVRLYINDTLPASLRDTGIGLVHPDYLDAPAGSIAWVEALNRVVPEELREPLSISDISAALEPLMNEDQ
jgi:hypothetical protein